MTRRRRGEKLIEEKRKKELAVEKAKEEQLSRKGQREERRERYQEQDKRMKKICGSSGVLRYFCLHSLLLYSLSPKVELESLCSKETSKINLIMGFPYESDIHRCLSFKDRPT